jgi:hypothetical protein
MTSETMSFILQVVKLAAWPAAGLFFALVVLWVCKDAFKSKVSTLHEVNVYKDLFSAKFRPNVEVEYSKTKKVMEKLTQLHDKNRDFSSSLFVFEGQFEELPVDQKISATTLFCRIYFSLQCLILSKKMISKFLLPRTEFL